MLLRGPHAVMAELVTRGLLATSVCYIISRFCLQVVKTKVFERAGQGRIHRGHSITSFIKLRAQYRRR